MKKLRKINKGLILTIIVLVLLISYLVSQEIQRGREKDNIIKASEEYLSLLDKYSMLPEKYRTVKTTIPKEEFKKYIESFKSEANQYVISNDKALDIQSKVVASNLEQTEMSDTSVTIKFNRKIKKIKKYEFDDDQVTVTLENYVEKDVKTIDYQTDEETTSPKNYTAAEDSITLKKEGNQWKIVYANLQQMSEDDMYGNAMMDI